MCHYPHKRNQYFTYEEQIARLGVPLKSNNRSEIKEETLC